MIETPPTSWPDWPHSDVTSPPKTSARASAPASVMRNFPSFKFCVCPFLGCLLDCGRGEDVNNNRRRPMLGGFGIASRALYVGLTVQLSLGLVAALAVIFLT